jgi:phage-related protein
MTDAKALMFCGSALDDLREFPLSARRDAGYHSIKSSAVGIPAIGSQ